MQGDILLHTAKGAKLLIDKPKREYSLEGSIFNYAVYALINPEVIKQWP